MKKEIKKVIASLLVFVMLVGFMPVMGTISASAYVMDETSGTCGANLRWTFNEATGEVVISGTGKMYNWDCIFDCSPWYYREQITKVTIKEGVTSIGDNAFTQCYNLASVSIPDTVEYIGYGAFASCENLTSVIIPESVTEIADNAFSGCLELASVIIPEGVTTIGEFAFSNCQKLAAIDIPESVTYIDYNPFYKTAYWSDLSNWENGVLYLDGWVLDSAPELISDTITVKAGTRGIAYHAFSECLYLKKLTIPESVTIIAGEGVLNGCKNLEKITVANNNPAYCSDAFGALLNKNKTELIAYPANAPYTAYDIPNGVTKIDEYTFAYNRNLKNVNIPNTVNDIGYGAFMESQSLESVIIPNSVTAIGGQAFCNCPNLTSVTIPNSVTIIGNYALAGKPFSDNSKLVSVYFPGSIKEIGWGAYDGTVYYEGTKSQWNSISKGKPNYINNVIFNHKHLDSDWVVVTEATASASGLKCKICSQCKAAYETEIIPAYGKVHSVTIDDFSLNYKDGTTVAPVINADAGVGYTITYSSSDESVVSVDDNGNVAAAQKGNAEITVTVTDSNGNSVTDTCDVEVKYTFWQWLIIIFLFGWIWY